MSLNTPFTIKEYEDWHKVKYAEDGGLQEALDDVFDHYWETLVRLAENG